MPEANPDSVVAMLEERLRRTPRVRVLDRAVLRYNLGLAYSEKPTGERQLNLTRAAATLEESSRLFGQAERPMEQARALNALGTVLKDLGRPEDALEGFQRAAGLLPAEINPGEHGAAMNNIGLCLGDLGRVDEADQAFRAALEDFSRVEFIAQRSLTYLNWGQVLAGSEEPKKIKEGIERYQQALELADPQEQPRPWAQIHHSMGVAYTGIGEPDKAAQAFQQALRVFTRTRFPFEHALTKNNLGLAWSQIGGAKALRRAVASYEDALRLLDLRIHREQWEQVYKNLDLAESGLKDLGEDRTRAQHFARMLAEEDAKELISTMRERLTELTLMSEPSRAQLLTEMAVAFGGLGEDSIRRVTGAWLEVLMELPQDQFLAGLSSWVGAMDALEPDQRLQASKAIDWAMGDRLLAPQRVRVRDTLYGLGWERPEED